MSSRDRPEPAIGPSGQGESQAAAPVPRGQNRRGLDRLTRARIAGQAGLVTVDQLKVAGWTPDAMLWQVTSGRWTRPHRGVYLTTPGRDDWEVTAVAALLAVGPPVCLCGESAGQAWGLLSKRPPEAATAGSRTGDTPQSGPRGEAVRVLVPLRRNNGAWDGIEVIRSRHYDDRVHPTEWPHRTTVEHTVFDLALGHGPDRAIALMAKACQLRLTTEAKLAAVLERRVTQPHRKVLREALGLVGEGAESAAEVRYIRDVEKAHGLPRGIRQVPAPGSRRRDSEYPDYGVVVEIDGRLGHVGWLNQQRDGRRDRQAAAIGKVTVRGGWPDLTPSACEFAAELAAIFGVRGWSGRARPCGSPRCRLLEAAA